jgi:hypothetical protein
MPSAYGKRPTEDLVSAFASAASERGEFLASSDPKRANAKFDQMAKLYGELRRRGLTAQRQLLPLLKSLDANVRLQAAAYALDFEPSEGEKALKGIVESETGLLQLTAEMTLEQWRKGEIRFSWVP